MSLHYSVVSRGTVVLAECSLQEGNAGAIARKILERLPESDTYVGDERREGSLPGLAGRECAPPHARRRG